MADINYSTHFSTSKASPKSDINPRPCDPKQAMNILFMAHMGGTKVKQAPIDIDRDNFDEVMEQLSIEIEIVDEQMSESFIISITELDDFHPDNLYQRVPLFQRLRELRQQLQNSGTYQQAVKEIQGWLVDAPSEVVSTDTTDSSKDDTNDGLLLDSILESSSSMQSAQAPETRVNQLVKEIVRPYIIDAPDPDKQKYIQAVDNALSEQMRKILHNPNFQQIESAWRDMYFLVRRLETDSQLKLFLLDTHKQSAADKLNDIITQQEDFPWGILLAHFTFNNDSESTDTLAALGNLGKQCNAPLLTAGHPDLLGINSFNQHSDSDDWPDKLENEIELRWQSLRSSDVSHYICLSLPRFLLRYPYGKKTGAITDFEFEELSEQPEHEHYLWGNSATLLTCMMAQAFTNNGWQFNANENNRIAGLPMHYYDDDGEKVAKPCGEINLTSRGGDKIKNMGLVPIFSVRNQDEVQVASISSINPDGELKGNWSDMTN